MELLEPPLPALQRLVQLHDVHVVAVEAAQRGFERGARLVAGADLGGDGDARPVRLERSAQQSLRFAGAVLRRRRIGARSEEHTSELQSLAYLVCRLLLEKKKIK